MTETRRYPRGGKRQLINYDHVIDEAGTSKLLCLDEGFLAICHSLVVTRGLWKSTYVKAWDETTYVTPTDEEMLAIRDIVSEGLTQMTSCTEIEQALQDIAAAISAQSDGGCGCGAGGAGGTSPAPDPTETDPPTLPGGTPPGGYADWDEYIDRKCDIAAWIIDNLENDMIWLEGVSIGAVTVGGLSLGLASVLSGGTLTAIVALGVGVAGLAAGGIGEIKDAVTNNKALLKCALFDAETAQGSIDNFESAMSTAIDAEIADTVARYVLKEFVNLWADTSQFNLMYAELDDLSPPVPTGADCSSCYNEFQLVAVDPFSVKADKLAVYDPVGDDWSITIDESTSGTLRYWNFRLIHGDGSSCDFDFTIAGAALDNFAVNNAPGPELTYHPCPSGSQQIINVSDKTAMENAINAMGAVRVFDIRMETDFVLTFTIS